MEVAAPEPAECVDMDNWWRGFLAPRYRWGANEYGQQNVDASPVRTLLGAAEEAADLLFYLRQALNKLLPQDGRLRIYVAGPYRSDTYEGKQENIDIACEIAQDIYRAGHSPFCPHSMTAFFDEDCPDIEPATYLTTDLDWLRCCHAIFLLPGWEDSEGALVEAEEAKRLGLPHYRRLEHIPSPEQIRRLVATEPWKLLT
jgi:hypothetical protein